MTTPINQSSYLRLQRTFPQDPQALSVELSKAYIDIANVVNKRIIGIFSNSETITGENWVLDGASTKQQTLREVFQFSQSGSIAHGINLSQISGFTRIYGTFTDGINWYPLPYVDVVDATNQVNIYVSGTDIVITSGAGSPPSIVSGYCVLEWLSNS